MDTNGKQKEDKALEILDDRSSFITSAEPEEKDTYGKPEESGDGSYVISTFILTQLKC